MAAFLRNSPVVKPEFSRLIRLSQLSGGVVVSDIEADPDERAALAKRFGLLLLERLQAHFELRSNDPGSRVAVTGRFTADVVQACVVTLDPVPTRIEQDFASGFSSDAAGPDDEEIDVAPEGEDDEPIVGDSIDIGEAVVQHFAEALPLYPRKTDATVDALEADVARSDPPEGGPFSGLAALKRENCS